MAEALGVRGCLLLDKELAGPSARFEQVNAFDAGLAAEAMVVS